MSAPLEASELLTHHGAWMRRFAAALAGAEGDDLVQETWLAVLKGGARVEHPRAWLARVMRNSAATHSRGERRRRRREEHVARHEREPSAADLVARAELDQLAARAVLDLSEPYRKVLLLRFAHGMEPLQIARRLGVPASTVRSRIARGLEEVRRRLDRTHGGDRAAWLGMLLSPGAGLGKGGGPSGSIPMGSVAKVAAGGALMSTKWIAAGGALAILTLLYVGGLRSLRSKAEQAPSSSGVHLETPEIAKEADEVLPEPTGEPASMRTAVHQEVVATPAPSPMLEGTIRVVDPEGIVHPSEDGSFAIWWSKETMTVAVQAGHFDLPRPPVVSFGVAFVELGGRQTFLDSSEVVLPREGPLELRATWAPPSILHVVDAQTGVEFDDLTVLRGIPQALAVHPGWIGGDQFLFARDARSPVELIAFNDTEDWWVHAPGYTWGHVSFDHRRGGEREVALQPGAANLEIRLDGFDPDRELWVFALPSVHENGARATLLRPSSDHFVLDGLPAGELQVWAEVANGGAELAREKVMLQPGGTSELVLDLGLRGALPEPVLLAGCILLPASHPELDFRCEITPPGGEARRKGDWIRRLELERVPDEPGVRLFHAGLVTPGRYLFASRSLQYWQTFDVGPGGATDVEIDLPEVGEVHVRVFEEETGERLTRDRLTWSAGWSDDLYAWTHPTVEADPASGEYAFIAPVGPISISFVWEGEYADATKSIDVAAGVQDCEMRVRLLPGAWIRLVDAGTTVPFESGWKVRISPAGSTSGGGEALARITRVDKGRAWVAARQPGSYLMEFPEIEDFEPIPPQTLDLGSGAPDEIVIELRRR